MEYKSIKCNSMNSEQIQLKIEELKKSGWEYTGLTDDFPPGMEMLHFQRNDVKSQNSLDTEPNN